MALSFPGHHFGLLVKRRRLLALLMASGLGLLQAPAASAAPFTGVCPVLGVTQPAYPTPLPPVVDPPLPPLPGLPIAIPQAPVRVNVGGQELPICAVYMSINQSLTSVAAAVAQFPPNTLYLPSSVPNDLLFPDLRAQPLFTAPGGSLAQAIASALVDNGFWNVGPTAYPWADDGKGFLVNINPSQQPNDSTYSAYFLWRAMNENGIPEGKARVLWYNTNMDVAANGEINWQARDESNLDPDTKYWFWVLDAPGGATDVPGPGALLGAVAAFRCSRRLILPPRR
jgi:hypothetical protein